MQSGAVRADVNVRVDSACLANTKNIRRSQDFSPSRERAVEIKNMNSCGSSQKRSTSKQSGQIAIVEPAAELVQETRLFDPDKQGKTRSMRSKGRGALTTRYFPDPESAALVIEQALG